MLHCSVSMKGAISSLASSSLPALAFQLMVALQEVIDELTVFYDAMTCHLLCPCSEGLCS